MEKEMEKEQRRRKIIARGTDRMALITGRINTLDPDPITKSSSLSDDHPDLPPAIHSRSTSDPLSAKDQAFFHYGGFESSDAATKQDHADEASKRKNSINRVPKEKVAANKSYINLISPFTAQAINFGLQSSEEIRAISSATLGLIVVLSHIIFHYTTILPNSFVVFRPLYVLLLTNFLIVVARLVPYARRRNEEKSKCEDDDNNLEGAVKLLELGLVLHQMANAIFIDCSFYLVVVILGLSLV